METGTKSLPESILVEILARLPLRNIARFKLVCKAWRSLIQSPYFRRHFISLHKNSSSSLSLMLRTRYTRSIIEAIGIHGCKKWGIPKSPGSYILPFQGIQNRGDFKCFHVASSSGLVLICEYESKNHVIKLFVGNPVLQQWFRVPWETSVGGVPTGLVTRVDEDGVVSSFKVIMSSLRETRHGEMYVWKVCVYSSETGLWTYHKRLLSPCPVDTSCFYYPLTLNGILYLAGMGVGLVGPRLLAYDFYGPESDDQCQVIPLPLPYDKNARRCLTTSGGDVIYIELLYPKLKVWRLMKNGTNAGSSEWWQLSREETDMASLGFDVNLYPLAMNPFDTDIVYLWSRQHSCLVLGYLRTQEFVFHQESDNFVDGEGCCVVNTIDIKRHIEEIDEYRLSKVLMLSQFVLPQWMDPVPRPPYGVSV